MTCENPTPSKTNFEEHRDQMVESIAKAETPFDLFTALLTALSVTSCSMANAMASASGGTPTDLYATLKETIDTSWNAVGDELLRKPTEATND